jgi:hypothetical protein
MVIRLLSIALLSLLTSNVSRADSLEVDYGFISLGLESRYRAGLEELRGDLAFVSGFRALHNSAVDGSPGQAFAYRYKSRQDRQSVTTTAVFANLAAEGKPVCKLIGWFGAQEPYTDSQLSGALQGARNGKQPHATLRPRNWNWGTFVSCPTEGGHNLFKVNDTSGAADTTPYFIPVKASSLNGISRYYFTPDSDVAKITLSTWPGAKPQVVPFNLRDELVKGPRTVATTDGQTWTYVFRRNGQIEASSPSGQTVEGQWGADDKQLCISWPGAAQAACVSADQARQQYGL